jgi:dihydroorotate dehydrogenase
MEGHMLIKLLHLLPPEDAHALTLWALKNGLAPCVKDTADISISLFGKKLRNPIGLSGGADKAAESLAGWSHMGFGLVEAGTVTVKPRTGNPRPRIWRFENISSLVNWMGLPGGGIEPFVENLKSFQSTPERQKLFVGASIASPDGKLQEFTQLAKACSPYVDYMTLNASCPNVQHGAAHGTPEQTAADQIKAARDGAGGVPVMLKLGPTQDMAVLGRMVTSAMDAGVNGFVATNTLTHADRALAHNLNIDWPTHDGKPVGGYSGGSLLPIACWMVKEIRAHVGASVPIIGVGGIQSGADAARMLDAGANAIQLYTGLTYKGPALIADIMQSLAARKK